MNGFPFIHTLVLGLSLILVTPGRANTLVVTNNADSGAGTLRNLVTNAIAGDIITFATNLSGATILLTNSSITVSNGISIDASGLSNGISINGNQQFTVFRVMTGTNFFQNLTITNGFSTNNVGSGGGAGVLNKGVLTLNQCTVAGNITTNNNGGGIYNMPNATLVLNQCTICGNVNLTASGGGLWNAGTSTVNQCTITANSAAVFGGGIRQFSGTMNVFNSIVLGNTAQVDAEISNPGLLNFTGINQTNGVPSLATLGNYGGPTPTMPPLPGSSFIDAGDDSATNLFGSDQRGFSRKVGSRVDIGAVEFNPAEAWVPTYTLRWAAGNSNWDTAGLTWKDLNNTPASYSPNHFVIFDDSTSAASPILITNRLVITSGTILFSNVMKDYSISGPGSIGLYGAASPGNTFPILKLGGGTLTNGMTNSFYRGTFTLGGGKLVIGNGAEVGLNALLMMSNNTALQVGVTVNTFIGAQVVIGAGANVTMTSGTGVGGGLYSDVSSADTAAVMNINSAFSFFWNLQGFKGTVVANSGTLRFAKDAAGAPDLGSTNANFIINAAALARPRNIGCTVNFGSLSGSGIVGGVQTPVPGISNTVISIGANNTSSTFSGTFVETVLPSGAATTNLPTVIVKVGTGTLTLTGNSTNSGATTVNSGGLKLVTGGSLSNSPVTVADGATNGVVIATSGDSCAVSNLTYVAGTESLVFDFGTNVPSTGVAPMRVLNNLVLSGSTLRVTVTGTVFPPGTYPLVGYAGALSGTPPSLPFSLPAPVAGYLTNIIASKVIALVVTNGNVVLASTPPLLTGVTRLGTGSCRFNFTSDPGAFLTIWASTNVVLPFTQWSNLGAPVESPAGTFTFTDAQATNSVSRFYRVSSP